MAKSVYMALKGEGGKRLMHWEHFSNPDAATYITCIDYYDRPKECLEKMVSMYPFLKVPMPATNEPIKRIEEQEGRERWGDHLIQRVQQEKAQNRFESFDEILSFSPLEQGDFTKFGLNVTRYGGDFRTVDAIYERYRKLYPADWGDTAPDGEFPDVGFYNTLFMWPLTVFGYENFLMLCLEPEFERIMDEFAEINRRVFTAFAKLPVKYVTCHDDIVLTNGPVVSPKWMHKHIFPRYEEFWSILKSAGKEVVFMADGNMDAFADDVMACGANGIISEPYTNYKEIARKHKDAFIAGEGDSRILLRNDKEEIKKMVFSMIETGKMSKGYMMCIGNHIPYNTPPEAVKYYFDLSAEYAYR